MKYKDLHTPGTFPNTGGLRLATAKLEVLIPLFVLDFIVKFLLFKLYELK